MNCACTNTYTCMRHRHPGTKLATQRASHSNSEARKRHPSGLNDTVVNGLWDARIIRDWQTDPEKDRTAEGERAYTIWIAE